MFFGEVIRDYVPESGIHAADIVEMMMLLRMAYACDVLSNYDYSKAALELADMAQELYHSWQEYAMATFCGCAYAVYRSNYSNLEETINSMSRQLTLLPHLDYFYYNLERKTNNVKAGNCHQLPALCFLYGLSPIPPSSVKVSPVIYLKSGCATCTQTRPISISASA